jgi:hypothetical protein
MLKKTLATGIALAVVVAISGCRQEPETAAIDGTWTTPADTAPLGVPGAAPGTMPPTTFPADTPTTGVDPVTGQPIPPVTP